MLTKPAWPRGLFVQQEHFEHADAYHEQCARRALARVSVETWGVNEIDWDVQALARGQVILLHLEGVLEDGTEIRVGRDAHFPQLSLQLADLGGRDRATVYAGVPLAVSGSNVDPEGTVRPARRYAAATHRVSEDSNEGRSVEVPWARPNVTLLIDGDRHLRGYDLLPCARILRDDNGHYEFDQTFVPPLWRIRASPYITERLDEGLTELVARKTWTDNWGAIDALLPRRAQLRGLLGTFVAEVADMRERYQTSPHDAYLRLIEILESLAPFTPTGACPTVPAFNHVDLGPTFSALFDGITEVLTRMATEQYRMFQPEPVPNTHWTFQLNVQEANPLDKAWFLAVSGENVEALKEQVLRLAKIRPLNETLDTKYASVPGVPLRWTPRPRGLPEARGSVYFEMDRQSSIFIDIIKTAKMGIHCPAKGMNDILIYVADAVKGA